MSNIGASFLAIMILFGPYIGYALGMWIAFKFINKFDKKHRNNEKGRQ